MDHTPTSKFSNYSAIKRWISKHFLCSQRREKTDIAFNDEDDTVSFYQYQYYTFNGTQSGEGLSEDDVITFLNIPYLVIHSK